MSVSSRNFEVGSAQIAPQGNVSASKRARKFRGRGSGEPSEKAAGQARAIVDDDAPANRAGLSESHLLAF
jgi:hypothetical protein